MERRRVITTVLAVEKGALFGPYPPCPRCQIRQRLRDPKLLPCAFQKGMAARPHPHPPPARPHSSDGRPCLTRQKSTSTVYYKLISILTGSLPD
jgi:hypothetical protein